MTSFVYVYNICLPINKHRKGMRKVRTIKMKFLDAVKAICVSDSEPSPEQIMAAMKDIKLTDRNKAIVVLYLSTNATLLGAAELHGISKERLRQIVNQAYRRVKKQWWYIFD